MSISDSSPAPRTTSPWHLLALGAVLLLALGLHFFGLEQAGYGNLYYAAAVKSMLTSWHNFFFVSFDPGGYVSVDKPPLGLWMQALSAMVFGFNGWALMLPQALAGVLSVALLYHLVRRAFGPTAGVIAALVLTLTPISIAANRNNTMDSQLVFTSLLAAWAVLKATETGKLRWLMAGAALVGLGFNIKMLQAYLVLPALYLLYLIAARPSILKRLWHLGLATVVVGVVSLGWAVTVDLTPAEARPFVGSSRDNTVMELIVGHNGAARLGSLTQLFGISASGPGQPTANGPADNLPPPLGNQFRANQLPPNDAGDAGNNPQRGPGGPSGETGQAGIFRLFNQQLGGQASWFIPMALVFAGILVTQTRWQWPLAREHQSVLLWSAWLVPQLIFFSLAGLFHRYYLEMLSPAIAALVGAGFAGLWADYKQGHWRGWLLPVAVAVGAVTEIYIASAFAEWAVWLIPAIISLCAVAVVMFLIARNSLILQFSSVTLGLLALLLAPALWSLTPLWASDAGLPYAGPELVRGQPRRSGDVRADHLLIDYLTTNRNGEKYLAATLNANSAAPLILATGEPVMALGGFSGGDNILTAEQLATRVASGEVRFFLLSAQQTPPNGGAPQGENTPAPGPQNRGNAATQWVMENCSVVNSSLWQSNANAPQNNIGPGGGLQRLYDCAANHQSP